MIDSGFQFDDCTVLDLRWYSGTAWAVAGSQLLWSVLRRITRLLSSVSKSPRIGRTDWADPKRRDVLLERVQAAGLTWRPLHYHKNPSALATAFDIARGIVVGAGVVMRNGVRIVHARSYVPSVIALVLKKLFRLRYIFDMRGFWADERIDGGLWPAGGRLYRMAKWFERRFLLNADCVVSLTHAAVDEIRTFPYLQEKMPRFEVITTCTDLGLFRPASDAELPLNRPFTLGYVGSVGN